MITAEQARQLLVGATQGPWSADDEHGLLPGACPAWVVSQTNASGDFLGDLAYIPQGGTATQAGPSEEPDARLMAAAPDLAETVIAQAEQIARVRAVLNSPVWMTAGALRAQALYALDDTEDQP